MTMPPRKKSGKGASSGAEHQTAQEQPAAGVLTRLSSDEANAVLDLLLKKHPKLRPDAEQIATNLVSSASVDEVAEDVFDRVTGVDLDALNGRAGAHSWGYVEPSEAANELLEESVEDLVEDLKRKAELGLAPAAEVICTGIVKGLYRARKTQSDGALGWDPDFPAEKAGYTVEELIRSCHSTARQATLERLVEMLVPEAPEWQDMLRRAVHSPIRK